MSLNTSEVAQYHPWMRGLKISDINSSFPLTLLERLTVQEIFFDKGAADSQASDTTSVAAFSPNRNMHLIGAKIIPHSTLTAHNTTYATVALKISTTTYASVTTKTAGSGGTGDWVANTPIALTVALTDLDKDAVVLFTIAKASTGVVVPVMRLQVTLAERAPF